MTERKILVTGGLGFIGSEFIRQWLWENPEDEVINLDAETYAGHRANLKEVEGNPNYSLIKGDICDPDVVSQAMEGVDVVVHFAAESHVDRSIIGPRLFVLTNILGTQTLLDEAKKQRIKLFHHVSTDEVYGHLSLSDPAFNEKTPLNPRSPYSASKASADMLVRAYHETYGLPAVITNTCNNYGPFQDPEKFIPRAITNLLQGEKIPLMGNGENIRDWIHVSDHCEGIRLVIESALVNSELMGETFCIGAEEEKTNLEVTHEILRIAGKDQSWIEHVEHRLGHDQRYGINPTKIRTLLGWGPSYDFEEGLAKTYRWYKENQQWWEPLKKGRPIVDRVAQQEYSRG